MTVASTATKTIVLGPGGGPFAYNFMIPTTSDVSIIYTNTSGVETVLTTSQYTITGVGTGSGTVTLTGSPLIAGETLTILRDIATLQLTSLQNQGASYPAAVETALDRLTMIAQQDEEVVSRNLTVAVSDAAPGLLPTATARALQVLGFDASGNPIAVSTAPAGTISSAMASVVAAASLAAGRTALGLGDIAVEDIGSGLADDGAGTLRVVTPTVAKAVGYALLSADSNKQYVATGPITLTLPLSTSLWSGWSIYVDAYTALVTLTPNVADSIEGNTAGASSYLPAGAKARVSTDAAGAWYVSIVNTRLSSISPGGYLTTESGYTVYPGDLTSKTTLYYTPDVHGLVPIYDGSTWADVSFSELSCALDATQQPLNTAHDVFVTLTPGAATLVIGPSWRNAGSGFTGAPSNFTNANPIVVTAASHGLEDGDIVYVAGVQGNTAANGVWTVANKTGSTFELDGSTGNGAYTAGTGVFSARGVGASTTQLARVGGLYTNAVSMTAYSGATPHTIPAGQGTYVGSILVDGTAGQLTCRRSWGQSRRWAVWNAYNRKPIILQAGDSTSNWVYSTATWRASNNNSANSAIVFCGLAEDEVVVDFGQYRATSGLPYLGIGLASVTVPNGTYWQMGSSWSGGQFAKSVINPIMGAVSINCLENGGTATTWLGSLAAMQMTVSYRG